MAHAQKPDFVFPLNGRVHLNRRGRQFSRLLAAELCASAVVMLDKPRSEVVCEYWLPIQFSSFPFTSPSVRHRVPSGFKRTIPLRMPRIKVWGRQTQPLVIFHFMIFYSFTCYESAYAEYDVRGVNCLLSPDSVVLCSNSVYVTYKCS